MSTGTRSAPRVARCLAFPLALLLEACPTPAGNVSDATAARGQDGGEQSASEDAPRDRSEGPEERRVVAFQPGESSDTLALKEPTKGFTLENVVLQASARTALICYQGAGPFEKTTLRNVRITVEPGTLPLDRSYWGIRGYDMLDTLFEEVEITGFGRVTERHDEGHAIYLNLAGSLTLEDCDLHHNGGQALQLVNRPVESTLADGPAEGSITVRSSRIRENGFNPDRGAFQVSIFGTGQPILLEDVEVTAGFDETEWPTGRTGGGILIEAERYDPGKPGRVWWRPADPPEGFVPPFVQGKTELRGVTVRHRNPDKPLVQIKGCEELRVTGCTFEGGGIELDHPGKPGRDSGKIVWEGNSGDVPVLHRGVRIGLASEDWQWPED